VARNLEAHFSCSVLPHHDASTAWRLALEGKIDILLKLSIAASVLFASSTVGYHYLVYVPRRDAQLDVERAFERLRADALQRMFSEQRALEDRQSAEKATALMRYQTCLNGANANYQALRATACKRLGEQSRKDHDDCISKNLGKNFCDVTYAIRDASPSCTLPRETAADFDADVEKARDRCLQENRSGL
jgi:hypothetical protein